jgi:hypothetical protein
MNMKLMLYVSGTVFDLRQKHNMWLFQYYHPLMKQRNSEMLDIKSTFTLFIIQEISLPVLFVYSFLFTDISNAILENNIYVRYC